MFTDKIMKLLELSMEISNKTEGDAFFHYSPHCDLVEVHFYEKKWSRDTYPTKRWSIYFTVTECRNEDEINAKFDSLIDILSSKLEVVMS